MRDAIERRIDYAFKKQTYIHEHQSDSGQNLDLDRLVQLTSQARLDTRTRHDWFHLAMPLSGHFAHVWLRFCPGNAEKVTSENCDPIRHQFGVEPHFYANSIWPSQPAICGDRHSDCLVNNHLGSACGVEALQVGGNCSDPLFCLGVNRVRAAAFNHMEQLGTMIIPVPTAVRENLPGERGLGGRFVQTARPSSHPLKLQAK